MLKLATVAGKTKVLSLLKAWCEDATVADAGRVYRFVYVDQEGYEWHPPGDFAALEAAFRDYQS